MNNLNPQALLKEAGLKATQGRIVLLQTIAEHEKPITPDRLMKKLAGKKIDQATVYRNLQTLKVAGIIRQVNFEHDHAHYELALDDHHHLICQKCGMVEDFEGCDADELIKRVLKHSEKFTSVERHAIELFGYCKKCFVSKSPA